MKYIKIIILILFSIQLQAQIIKTAPILYFTDKAALDAYGETPDAHGTEIAAAGTPALFYMWDGVSWVSILSNADGAEIEDIGVATATTSAVSLGQMLDSLSRSCAEMYITSASPQVLAITSGAYSKIIGHSTDAGFLVGFTYATGTFTKTSIGTQEYYITASVSGSFGTGNTVIEANVFVNNVVVGKIAYTRKIGTGGDVGSAALSGLLSLTLNDTIDVRLKADNTNNWTTENLNFSVIQAN